MVSLDKGGGRDYCHVHENMLKIKVDYGKTT
jgi:hypothetical protein